MSDRAVFRGYMMEVPAGIFEPLDITGGPPPPWPETEVEAMNIDQRRQLAYDQRIGDGAGQDSAYDLGLSTVNMPAPRQGWPLDTPREKLTRGVD
jgi:hypothetical protein